jgi:hypothetical protein
MRTFWPIGEASQADYEALREAALAGATLCSTAAGRFERAGLAGLVVRPVARPVFVVATLAGAARPPWAPYGDPRTEVLADVYDVLVAATDRDRAERARPAATEAGG